MPDPSAARPLPLPNPDLEALELLILEPCNVECMFYRPNSAACPGCSAVAILRHFGPRLLPSTAERREWVEYGTETVYPAGHDLGPAVIVHARADPAEARAGVEVVLRVGATSARAVRRSKTMFVGSWVVEKELDGSAPSAD